MGIQGIAHDYVKRLFYLFHFFSVINLFPGQNIVKQFFLSGFGHLMGIGNCGSQTGIREH
jgi:hypothetical protein